MGARVIALSTFAYPGDLVRVALGGGQITLSCVLYKKLRVSSPVMHRTELTSSGDLEGRTEVSASP